MQSEMKPRVIKCQDSDTWIFYCPGCAEYHQVKTAWTEKEKQDYEAWCRRNQFTIRFPTWTFNGDVTRPTFSPSVHVSPHQPYRTCHSYIRDGKIQYLSDSWHHLRGQTIDLPEVV